LPLYIGHIGRVVFINWYTSSLQSSLLKNCKDINLTVNMSIVVRHSCYYLYFPTDTYICQSHVAVPLVVV